MTVLKDAHDKNLLFYNAFYGAQSSYMQDRWSTIRDQQLIDFTKIIIGEKSLNDGFSSWLQDFKKMGGDKITEDVNQWYKNNK